MIQTLRFQRHQDIAALWLEGDDSRVGQHLQALASALTGDAGALGVGRDGGAAGHPLSGGPLLAWSFWWHPRVGPKSAARQECKLPPLTPLDNPVWHSLTSSHANLAIGKGLARRYPAEVAPFVGVESASAQAADEMLKLVEPGERVGLVGLIPKLGEDWRLDHAFEVRQYVWDHPTEEAWPEPEAAVLGEEHLKAMLELTAMVYPAYFRPGTARLGHYVGIIQDGVLCAMAGIRMAMGGYQELSAICTHPDHRAQGYATRLTRHLVHHVMSQGDVAFLHTESDNLAAQRVYERLGFSLRRVLPFDVVERRATMGA